MSRPSGSIKPHAIRRGVNRQIADRRNRDSAADGHAVRGIRRSIRVSVEDQVAIVGRQIGIHRDAVVGIRRQNIERRRAALRRDRSAVACGVEDEGRDVRRVGDSVDDDRGRVRSANRQRAARRDLIKFRVFDVERLPARSQSDRVASRLRVAQRDVSGTAVDRSDEAEVGGSDHHRVVGNRDR